MLFITYFCSIEYQSFIPNIEHKKMLHISINGFILTFIQKHGILQTLTSLNLHIPSTTLFILYFRPLENKYVPSYYHSKSFEFFGLLPIIESFKFRLQLELFFTLFQHFPNYMFAMFVDVNYCTYIISSRRKTSLQLTFQNKLTFM